MSKTIKYARYKCALNWLMQPGNAMAYQRTKLNDEGATILATMTEKQLHLVNAIAAGSYSRGADESRSFWSPKFHALRKALLALGMSSTEIMDVADEQAVSRG